jgi:hypothetical protein
MKKYNRSEVMSRAWRIYRKYPNQNWSTCLSSAWAVEKNKQEDISPKMMNKILNNLRSFNRQRSSDNDKLLMSGTKEHFKLMNCRIGRKIMKLPEDDDSKQMLAQGELVGFDIINQRRKESIHFIKENKLTEKKFRNRIINLDKCERINIEEYV